MTIFPFVFIASMHFVLLDGNLFGDYKKNYDPVIAVVFNTLLSLIFFFLIAYFLWAYYTRVVRYRMLCNKYQIHPDNVSFLNTFIQKLHVAYPAFLLEKQYLFDEFSNHIAETYHRDSSVDDIAKEAFQFYTVRKQLKFRHGLHNVSRVRSSRALTKEYPLRILYFDETKKTFLIFESEVIERNEFFLIIKGPSLEMSIQILGQSQPYLEVWFRVGHKEYRFDTRCWFARSSPNNVWYLGHSKKLNKIDILENINLAGSLLYSTSEGAEDIEDYPIRIHTLEYNEIKFSLCVSDMVLQIGGYVVINFKLKETELACQGVIAAIVEQQAQPCYRVPLKNISNNYLQMLLLFMRNPVQYS